MLFQTPDKVITIVRHGDDHIGQEILAYAQVKRIPIHDIDIARTKVSETHWIELAGRMGLEVKDLINREHANYKKKFTEDYDFSEHDWLKVLEHNTEVLAAPIIIKGDKIKMMTNPQDMIHFI